MTQPYPETSDEKAAALLIAVSAPVDHEKLRQDIAESIRTGPHRHEALRAQLGLQDRPSRRSA